ncbi:MAG: hypothetical protein AWT59_1084 [Candidatus Gallionella acididurans]|uniref:SHOCT domain-containing protein n=1 Tax=Candidatus Gallionella acididurans TaxID=1796491 RepID=A0A139BUX4_9PROT|nr:MAG: hypothetical protein AWT59_1084 [Candidatus Gallionella acididurans]
MAAFIRKSGSSSNLMALITKENQMNHYYWNDWYAAWGWMLWFGIVFLLFSNIGNWGYSYRAHQKYDSLSLKTGDDILNERYARGEISREEYGQMKSDISGK